MAGKRRSGRSPGLTQKPNGIWHIDRVYRRRRICESTGTSRLADAEEYLAHRLDEVRREIDLGERTKRSFDEAAAKYLLELTKKSARDDIRYLDFWVPRIGNVDIDRIHDGTLAKGVKELLERGLSRGTINHYIELVRLVLKCAEEDWRDPVTDNTWLLRSPKLTKIKKGAHLKDARVRPPKKPYPLTWDEQEALILQHPPHLREPTEFAALTGMRENEIVKMEWDWLRDDQPGCLLYVFISERIAKSERDEVVALCGRARELIEAQRGRHAKRVWTWWMPHAKEDKRRFRPTTRLHNRAWRKAWKRAGLPADPQILRGVHNMRHTFATRLRAEGVPLETRKLLLRHASEDITTRYSHAQWAELLTAVERIAAPPTPASRLSLIEEHKSLAKDGAG